MVHAPEKASFLPKFPLESPPALLRHTQVIRHAGRITPMISSKRHSIAMTV